MEGPPSIGHTPVLDSGLEVTSSESYADRDRYVGDARSPSVPKGSVVVGLLRGDAGAAGGSDAAAEAAMQDARLRAKELADRMKADMSR